MSLLIENAKLEEAEIYRLFLSAGYLTSKDIIVWADSVINNLDCPPYTLIEISLEKETLKINNLLLKLSTKEQGKIWYKVFMKYLYERSLISETECINISAILNKLWAPYLCDDEYDRFESIYQDFQNGLVGITPLELAIECLKEYLEQFT